MTVGTTSGAIETVPAKVALITGAGSGIGAATAESLADDGFGVALLGRGLPDLQQVSDRLERKGAKTLILRADVGDSEAMENAFQELVSRWSRLDAVVANAGINGVWAPLEEITPAEWDDTFHTNVRGAYQTLRLSIPLLRAAGGSVVIVSSINGSRTFGNLGASAYAASKGAQVALAKMAARELAQHRIRVNVVCPGSITTDIESSMQRRKLEALGPKGGHGIPLTDGKPGEAAQVAQLIRFLISDQANHITGTEVFIDGAESLFGG
jgi:NAD(P)-dependent dehydrogenase (short-subunit alcohol dehydrogenase family)